MIRAILFDLDATLLDNDMRTFLPPYFQALCARLGDRIPPERLTRQVMESTQRMIQNTDPTRTNQEVFADDFFPKIGHGPDELGPVFADFYERDFPALRKYTRPRPEARGVVQECFDRGYDVVIATSPVFPLRAVQHRLEWAGVADFPYALITTYENMHSCKPQPRYYLEIAERIGHAPSECMMVGNDPEADIVPASKAGMRTFYVVYGEAEGQAVSADYRGTLEDFLRLIRSWPAPREAAR